MLNIKRLAAITVLALVATFCAPQAFAGDMATGITGDIGTPGIAGDMHTPGVAGDILTPGLNGEILTPPGFDGWIGTGLAAIASLFS
jgi:hypothetical protein